TLIACPDASLVTPGVTTFTDAAGVTWTAGPQTEVVDLDMGTGEVPAARTITAGTGLTGGGDLTADRTLTVDFGAGAGKVTQGNDSRLSDARTPTAHVHSAADLTSGTIADARLPPGLLAVQGNGPAITATSLTTMLNSAPTITAAVGDHLRVIIGGRWNNQSGSAKNFTVAVSLGGVTVCSTSLIAAVSSAAPDRIWKLVVDCFVASTSSIVCVGDGLFGSGSMFTSVTGTGTGDITAGLTFDVRGSVQSGGSQGIQALFVTVARSRA
ncbi:MAG: hypothetical protein JST64_14675, partial [Actinobacteria bacterium]|nr:hypothetical protein [Actinomycetota bacterium]